MGRRIPQPFIDEIISRADIVDVVGRRVSLKRAGSNLKGLCPFHEEKTPSFIVTPARNTYHCFGCAAHGTAIDFLMNFENMRFPEAIEALAEMLGLSMPESASAEPNSDIEPLYALLGEAARLFRRELREHRGAIDYLHRRGIAGTTVARFDIGYAPDAWDTVLKTLGTSEARIDKLIQAGLVKRSDKGNRYDVFRRRIMFPIRDARGRVIGFGGRALGEGEPKYLNSPETPVFHKSRSLFGLYEAREFKGRPEQVFVVEGYIDVTSLTQHGVGPALATLGTATTPDHVRRLTRMTDRVVFCFDGDSAGRKAAWRALETALPFAGGSVELKFLLLPEGQDPDSLVSVGGSEAFLALLGGALPLSEFFIDELRRGNDTASVDGRARLFAMATPLLGKLPHGIYRELLIGELAEAVGIPPAQIEQALEHGDSAISSGRRTRQSRQAQREHKSTLVRKAIALVLHYPSIAAAVDSVDGFDVVQLPGVELLRSILAVARAEPSLTTAHLIERFREDPDGRYLPRIAARAPLDDADAAAAVLRSSLERIVADDRRRRAAAAIRHSDSRIET